MLSPISLQAGAASSPSPISSRLPITPSHFDGGQGVWCADTFQAPGGSLTHRAFFVAQGSDQSWHTAFVLNPTQGPGGTRARAAVRVAQGVEQAWNWGRWTSLHQVPQRTQIEIQVFVFQAESQLELIHDLTEESQRMKRMQRIEQVWHDANDC